MPSSPSPSVFARIGHRIEPEVREHLAKVYGCLAATTLFATGGALVHLLGVYQANLFSAIASVAVVILLTGTAHTSKNFGLRFFMLCSFGALSGHSMGPLLAHVMQVNPQVIVTAVVATSVVFTSFSISALLAERGTFIFLGAILSSVLTSISLFSLANIFMQSQIIYQAHVYIGLVIMSLYILYDTQSIMEKRRLGNDDCVKHALELFFDLASVFRKLLIILTQKEEREQNRRRKQN